MGNSVIYRPAYDAEVEYLESTGTQYIDTGIHATELTSASIDFELTQIFNDNALISMDSGRADNMSFTFEYYNTTEYPLGLVFSFDGVVAFCRSGLQPATNVRYDATISSSGMTVNGTTYNPISSSNAFTSPYTLFLYAYGRNGNPIMFGKSKIRYCKIYQNSILVRDFIPVRIGSVGYMYDKVSKQLFANKGTGNFILGNDVSNAVIPQQRCVLYFGSQRSVGFERIYEEYEWLCGDGTKYIRIKGYARNEYWTIRTKCRVRGAGAIEQYPQIYGAVYYNNVYGSWALFASMNITTIATIAARASSLSSYHDNYFDYNYNDIISITDEHNSITINNITKPTIADRAYFDNDEFWLFSTYDNRYTTTNPASRIADADISQFTITENGTTVLDLTPCKLLQSIPAILDGNGITRQAGECGMWDKVSNKFYGNVASSGTFTVEGPKCYEEYRWLKAEIPIGVAMMSLPINSSTFNCTIEHTGARANLPHLYSDGYIYYTNSSNMDMIAVWNISEVNTPFSASVGSSMIIESNEEYFKVNNISITKYGFPILRMVIQSSYNSNNATTTKTSKITVDGIERYVPCKLTHGIPASMDANGIARPAGTCGMWDKVNDKFYGNVANSGTFTVSND